MYIKNTVAAILISLCCNSCSSTKKANTDGWISLFDGRSFAGWKVGDNAASFTIENGAIAKPVSEMNITGNMKDLWSNIGEIGNDVNLTSSWLTPSIVFEGVDFSGI